MTDGEVAQVREDANRVEHAQRQAIRWLGIVAVLSLVLASLALYQNRTDARHNRDRIDDIVAARAISCHNYNEAIDIINESRDATADLLEGLRSTIEITDPNVIAILNEAIARTRVVIPPQDCGKEGSS